MSPLSLLDGLKEIKIIKMIKWLAGRTKYHSRKKEEKNREREENSMTNRVLSFFVVMICVACEINSHK